MKQLFNRTNGEDSNHVHTTTDYSLFKSIDGNRTKNKLHLKRLKNSMQQNYLFTVIIVNEKYEIIDGQHRFDIIRDLKLPLHYIICKGYGLKEVHVLNANSKTWNADDYLTGYCDMGYDDYLIYRDFKNQYKIGHNECLSLLSGYIAKSDIKEFYEGRFKIKSLKDAKNIIEKILVLFPYYKGVRRRSFIYAMMGLLKNPNFNYSEFVSKLKLQPTKLVDCPDITSYKSLIEDIYNYRRHEKVNLRY